MSKYETALAFLRQYTGNDKAEFRDGQWDAIDALANGGRIAVIERTGWGKSAVYLIAAKLLRDAGGGPALLVSPLLSLIRDQINAAGRMGVRAETINCSNVKDWARVERLISENLVDILLVSPERLGKEEFLESFMEKISGRLSFLAIDEAHCISDWGHDFRPDYLRIRKIIEGLPQGTPVLATTATANQRVEEDLHLQLGPGLRVIRGEMRRLSLRLQTMLIPGTAERMAWLLKFLRETEGTGIVYVLTQRHAGYIAEWLRENGVAARAYHADVSGLDGGGPSRESLETMLLNNQVKTLVSTVALGMGFDKPDLAFVVHFHRPASVVHYYQQAGRAGRAIDEALGILIEGSEDKQICDSFIDGAWPEKESVDKVLAALSERGESVPEARLQRMVNLKRSEIDQVMKILEHSDPSPIEINKDGVKLSGKEFTFPAEKVEALKALRQGEQETMRRYVRTKECLMAFLARELGDDATASKRCGKCSNCIGRPLYDGQPAPEDIRRAEDFLVRRPIEIEPRKRLPSKDTLKETAGMKWTLDKGHIMEPGRAMSYYGFGTVGSAVKKFRSEHNICPEELAAAAAAFIKEKWFPGQRIPFNWITSVPSSRTPHPLSAFMPRLAEALGLPLAEHALLSAGKKREPQELLRNSHTQLKNLDGEYLVNKEGLLPGSALLVDDICSSRWTLTLTTALLRQAGVPKVWPFALSMLDPYHVE